ncbi:hypothetical protein SDIAM103S_05477 [Streptomyces diastaticus subsp. diastaticus]
MVHAGRRVPVVITHGRQGRSVPWHARMAPARLPVRHGTECWCIRGPGKQGGTDNARQEYMNSSPNECNRKVCAPWKRHRNTDRMKRQPHRARQRSRSQTKPHRSAPMTSSSHGSTQSPVRTDPGGASPYHSPITQPSPTVRPLPDQKALTWYFVPALDRRRRPRTVFTTCAMSYRRTRTPTPQITDQDPDQVRTNLAQQQTIPPFVAAQRRWLACTTSRRRTSWDQDAPCPDAAPCPCRRRLSGKAGLGLSVRSPATQRL